MIADFRKTFESLVGDGKDRAAALRLMDQEAQEASIWAQARITRIEAGNSGYTQPDTNIDGVRIRLVCNVEDGWLDTFQASVLQLLSREHGEQDGEVFCYVVIRQADDPKRRTRLKGYVTKITDEALTFFDGVSVRVEDITEVAL